VNTFLSFFADTTTGRDIFSAMLVNYTFYIGEFPNIISTWNPKISRKEFDLTQRIFSQRN
jgi:hypothetical protein